MIVCDTHVLLHHAFQTRPFGAAMRRAFDRAAAVGELACSDVSLWEIAALVASRRLPISGDERKAIAGILATCNARVLPIDADIAVTAAGLLAGRTDPFDRLIAATAIVHNAPLLSVDERMRRIPGLKVVW